MNPIAITKARARLAKAREAKERIKTSRDFDEFESAWTDFLLAANSIYTCLEQGSKDTAQSRQWFGGMKKGRRQDALLQYLHQARNADEHGLQPIAELRPGHIAIGKGGEPVHIRSMVIHNGRVSANIAPVDGNLPTIEIAPSHAGLVVVYDSRYGTHYPPPTHHLGLALTDGLPLTVAELGCTYHAQLIEDAEKLAH